MNKFWQKMQDPPRFDDDALYQGKLLELDIASEAEPKLAILCGLLSDADLDPNVRAGTNTSVRKIILANGTSMGIDMAACFLSHESMVLEEWRIAEKQPPADQVVSYAMTDAAMINNAKASASGNINDDATATSNLGVFANGIANPVLHLNANVAAKANARASIIAKDATDTNLDMNERT